MDNCIPNLKQQNLEGEAEGLAKNPLGEQKGESSFFLPAKK